MNFKKTLIVFLFSIFLIIGASAQTRSVIGVFPFESYEINKNDTIRIYDIFYDKLVSSGRFDVYSKKALFTWYQDNADGSPMSTGLAVKGGLELNLDFSLYGSVSQLGKRFTIIVTQVDPESGLIEYVAREMVDSEKEIPNAVAKVAAKFIERTPEIQENKFIVEAEPEPEVITEPESEPEPEPKAELENEVESEWNTEWDVEWEAEGNEEWSSEEEWEEDVLEQENYFEFSIGGRLAYGFNPFKRALFTVGSKTRYDRTAIGAWVGFSREEDWYYLGALQLSLFESEKTQKNATAISVIGRWQPNMSWEQVRWGVGVDWYLADDCFLRGTTMINDWLDISASVGWSF